MTIRYYSSVASEKTLNGFINAGALSFVVSDTIGLPNSFPYTLALDYETVSEELVNVVSAAGTTLTVDARGVDGTTATSHNAGARVRHVTSARDFTDSRNHENSSDGVHGLAPGEDIVGTDSVQTLSNKTFVNAAGSFLNPDFNLTGTAVSSWVRTPAGADTVVAQELVNGAEQTYAQFNNGHVKVRNTAALDAAVTTRRISTTMADGTTERFYVEASGQVTSKPRSGTASGNSGFKVIDPEDMTNRRLIKVMDVTDATERFTVDSGGTVSVTTRDPGSISLFLKQAPAAAVSSFLIQDSAAATIANVDSAGVLNARRRAIVFNDTIPGSVVLQARGHATQSGDLQQWQNNAGNAVARVQSDGSSDFTSDTLTGAAVFTAAAGWSISQALANVKAGIVTIHLNLLRTGASIVASADGDLTGDPPLGTVAAALRPHTSFGAESLVFLATTPTGSGAAVQNASTGDMNMWNFSGNGTIFNGINLRLTMTYPLLFT